MILQQQDSVGLVLFDDAVRRYLKPAGQPSQLKEIFHLLDVTPAREKSDLGLVFNDLAERFKKRGVVAVFSDLFDDVARIITGLKHFRHRRHEVIVFHILDPAELEFPFRDPTLFKGLEGMADILTDPYALRHAYQTEIEIVPHGDGKGVPDDRHRLRAASDRSKPRRSALELPGIAISAHPLVILISLVILFLILILVLIVILFFVVSLSRLV